MLTSETILVVEHLMLAAHPHDIFLGSLSDNNRKAEATSHHDSCCHSATLAPCLSALHLHSVSSRSIASAWPSMLASGKQRHHNLPAWFASTPQYGDMQLLLVSRWLAYDIAKRHASKSFSTIEALTAVVSMYANTLTDRSSPPNATGLQFDLSERYLVSVHGIRWSRHEMRGKLSHDTSEP